jgi:hypothetical protein
MTATIIDLRTRRPLLRAVPTPRTTDPEGDVIRRIAVVGRTAGMPDDDVRFMAALGLRRFKAGDTEAAVVAWARAFVRDFMRHYPGPGAA